MIGGAVVLNISQDGVLIPPVSHGHGCTCGSSTFRPRRAGARTWEGGHRARGFALTPGHRKMPPAA